MNQSAPSLRERQTAERSLALRTEARRLTAERGISGFTIEELCSEVGVSRRTFFNYFGSKENAVLGIPVRTDSAALGEVFAARNGDLLTDLVELHVARWAAFALTRSDAEELGRVVEREPRLVAHMLSLAEQGERDDIALVARRLGASPDDVRAQTAVQLVGSLLRPAVVEYFATDADDFRSLLLRRLDAARELLSR